MNPVHTLSAVAQELGISRQALYKNSLGKVRMFYKRKEDETILALIQQVVENRSTYGYKRITAMVNRLRATRVNKKTCTV